MVFLGYGAKGNVFYKYANDTVFPTDTLAQDLLTYKLFFVNGQTGYMIYSEEYESPMHHLLKTVDGGFSWMEISSDTLNSFDDLYFPSDQVGFMVCSSRDIYRTSDMGDGCTTNLHPLIQKQNTEADIISTFTQQQTGIEASSENPKGVGATKLGIAQWYCAKGKKP